MAYFHWDGLHFKAVATHFQTHHAGLAIQGGRLVEDEIAYAIVDGMTIVVFDGLEGVGMVTDEHVGASETEHVCIMALTGYRLQLVFCAPVE